MAVVSTQYLEAVLTNFRSLFAREFNGAMQLQGWRQFTMRQDTPGDEFGTYEWFGTVPQMQDVTNDQVQMRGLDEYNFTIRNLEYQAALEVSRMSLERDNLNLIRPRISQLSGEAARHPGELIFKIPEQNPDAYDGISFFNDTRIIGESANIDNIIAGTGIDVTAIQDDLNSSRERMRLFEDDRGRPLNKVPNAIMCPIGLELTIWRALNPTSAGNLDRANLPVTSDGVLQAGGYSIIGNPYLTDLTDWYIYHLGGNEMRPFIWQIEKRTVLESDTDPNTRENILKRNYLYSIYGRYSVGVSDPRLAIKITNT